ncbi:lipoprotein-releasing ABC transporter permease subunit [Hellea balneolensis]|uniref:lipoprotein-releasing ABC transporter permease subunit n=1 Tax=Hellea balneolensis TaxID=287478 RepID=UPI0004151AAA|nr:lipoprotein-releasing ABC transporter permease subunit [Hellea balneolensis]
MNAPADIKSFAGGQNKPFGAVERMIAMRYLRAKKTQGGVGLIAAISFTCIMLAIAAMIIIMSIMNGFREDMIRLTIGSEGHMYVASSSPQPTPESVDALEKRLATVDGVEKSFQFTQDFTGVQANGQFALAQVIGISPQNLQSYELISYSVIAGSLQNFGLGRSSENQIAIGIGLASQLGLSVGDRLLVFSPRTRQTISGPVPVKKAYTVGAIFQVGLYQTDLSYIYMEFNQATQLFEGGRVSGEIQLRLENPDDIDRLQRPVTEAAQEPIFIQTWKDRNATTATALRTEQIAMRFIFMIVVIIAAFPVLASMIMLVKNKSKDIAILRTIGTTQGGILRIFFMSGAMIGILGTLVGLILGILFCLNIGAVQWAIETVTGTELFPADVYQLSGGIPAKIVWSEVFGVAFWGFVISAAATFFPAWTASKIDPVDALRYE